MKLNKSILNSFDITSTDSDQLHLPVHVAEHGGGAGLLEEQYRRFSQQGNTHSERMFLSESVSHCP